VIDDYAKAMELVRKMKAQLPIPARPTGSFVRAMRRRPLKIARGQELQIQDVLYLGDEGGISCNITPSPDAQLVLLVSITHLRVPSHHPLAAEIRTYQRARARKLAQSGGPREPSSFTVHPRKKRRR
jgi:hypothetical protein